MKILILGGEGMLGHKMHQTLSARHPGTLATVRGDAARTAARYPVLPRDSLVPDVDLMNFDTLEAAARDIRPDVIVNCVGIIKQRDSASDHIQSLAINAMLPHRLAHMAADWGGRMIHFSTDCVFSGDDGGYTEESFPDARDLYGRSKFLGEVAEANALTLRTSIIGRELKTFKSLLEWFLSNRGGAIKGFRKVIYSGVTTNYMAELVGDLITDHPALSGLYQVASAPIDKHDLLCRLNGAYGAGVAIEPVDDVISDRSMLPSKFEAATGLRCPDWDTLIRELAADPTPYEEWRS